MSTAPRIVISRIADLDGNYLDYQVWTQNLDFDDDDIANGVICQAFQRRFEIAKLAISASGKILIVEVDEKHRRKGIATLLYRELVNAGYPVEHDWDNMRDDGAAWAQSLDS